MNDMKKNRGDLYQADKPFFSIIIPVYNASEYLKECLESILSQEFKDWEAILVDDCSTDGSVEISENYSKNDSRIKVYKSEKNSGCAYVPRLRAANLSKGKYIVSIDADDKVSSDLLKLHHQIINSQKADLVIPEMWKLKGSKSYKILPLEIIDTLKIWSGKDLVAHTLCHWDIPMSGFAMSRDAYLAADRELTIEDRKSIFSDELLTRWMLFRCQCVAFSTARYYYRQNDESVTNTNAQRYIDSKLLTCDSLIAMVTKTFGDKDSTYFRALENKLYSAVDLLRLLNNQKFEKGEKEIYTRKIASALKDFDFSKLKGKTSPRYLMLMQFPIPLARIALKFLDTIFNK